MHPSATAPAHAKSITLRTKQLRPKRGPYWIAYALVAVLCVSASAPAQNPTPQSASPAAGQAAPVVLPHPTTTVEVHGDVKDDYLAAGPSAATLDGATLKETPLSVSSIARGVLSDQIARTLTDVVKNDASIGEDYAPVGYYGDYTIRGFAIDLATGLEINGLTIAGEQEVPLENKQAVEVVKGIASVESGVTSAGGFFNFVTKRPALVRGLDLATDHRGSAYSAADFGHFFGKRQQVGARVNVAGERIQSYVNGADGWRAAGTGAADWKLTPRAVWQSDFEYQHKVERSVSGYQLLGGSTLPDLGRISPATMLGFQPWAKPNTFDTYNASTKLHYDLPHGWRTLLAASYSHSLIDDNVVYAYGTPYDPETYAVTCPGAPDAPSYFFCPDGTYAIYDYRNPGELRINAQAEALVTGTVHTGALTHQLAAGGEMFTRSVRMPGFYTADNPSSPDGVVQDGSVYWYIGEENIYEPNTAVDLNAAEDPHQQAGPRRLYENNHQPSLLVQDRVLLPGRIQLLAGGRLDSLRDHNYSAWATDPTAAPILTDKNLWLPQYAATWTPTNAVTVYGNYGELLSLGPQAPWWVDNGSQYLARFRTRQAEVGAKIEPGRGLLVSTALFRMRQPYFYPKLIDAPDSFCTVDEFQGTGGDQCFESAGHETHSGAELNAQGRAANWLQITASLAATRGEGSDTGTPAYDNKQVLNLPHVRAALFADVAVPHMRGLHLMPGWSYTGRKAATRDGAVSVSGYNLFNLGARYTPGGEQGHVTLRLYADNVDDKRYWKDTGASYGDTFVHLGAPTTVRLSAHYTF